MSTHPRVVVTGTGAICATGRAPEEILEALLAGRSAIGPIRAWDASAWPARVAAEIAGVELRDLVRDRKLLKLIRRTDVLGLYAASAALDGSGLPAWRDALPADRAALASDRTGIYVGAGGGTYSTQYDFFPLLTEAKGDLQAFGRELPATVNPMWLLRTLPNNVLCHIGINYGLKGTNACITNHSVGGALAVVEAFAGLRAGEAERAVAIGHEASIEPQHVLYYYRVGLVSPDGLRPFDAAHNGSVFGEGAGALVLETAEAAAARGAAVLGEVLGCGYASEGAGLLEIREDGDGLARAIRLAFEDSGLEPRDVAMIVAHGNGTARSDASEAAAIRSVFGSAVPPVTAFKWSFGHLLAAAGALEAVIALAAMRAGVVPGIGSLVTPAPSAEGLPLSRQPVAARGDVALVLSRGFGSTDAALLLRAPAASERR
jgi:3-oxoacyl-[acyl-carrier-protein] synthase-1